MKKNLDTVIRISTALLLCATGLSYFSFNYFYLYGHIENFSDFVFCLLQWAKPAGIAAAAGAVFIKSKRLAVPLKYLYIILPLLSLFWAKKYFSLENNPVTDTDYIYYHINNIMPAVMVKSLFFAEAFLLALTALLTGLRDGYRKEELKQISCILPVAALTLPLNIFANLTRYFGPKVTRAFSFSNFGVWHLAAIFSLIGGTLLIYYFLKNKSSQKRYQYMSMLAVVLLIQYMSRASMLMGDGYNIYRSIIAFLPLFVCNIGVFVASLAVFTKNKRLADIAFFVHAGGALSVFVYFGKPGMSEYGTIFSYTFLYFVLTHLLLFVLCVMPLLLKEYRFRLKRCAVPLCYYAAFIFLAAVVSGAVSSVTFSYGSATQIIYPNFSFTQNSPIENTLPQILIRLFGMQFDILYLSILFAAYTAIFFATFALYHFGFARRAWKTAAPPVAEEEQSKAA